MNRAEMNFRQKISCPTRMLLSVSAMGFLFASPVAAESWSCENRYPDLVRVFQKQGKDIAVKTTGYRSHLSWRMNSKGYIEDTFDLSSNALLSVNIKAKAEISQNGPGAYWPELQVTIDGFQLVNITVDNTDSWRFNYIGKKQEGIHRSPVFEAGQHKIRISYNNDWADHENAQGRDVRIEKVEVFVKEDGCSMPRDYTRFSSLHYTRSWSGRLGFPVGAILNESGGSSRADTDPQYRSKLNQLTYLTPENQFKMGSIVSRTNRINFERPDAFSDYVQENRKRALHGHTLAWAGSVPNLSTYYNSRARFETWVRRYFDRMIDRYSGEFKYWQVVNEPLDWEGKLRENSIFYERMGSDYIAKLWQMAEDANPGETELIINEFKVLDLNEKSDGLYALVKNLLNRGYTVDGVGFQAHIDISRQPNFSTIKENIERFVALGVDVHLTELDVRIDEDIPNAEEVQANIYYQVIATCLDTPGCSSVNFWGLTDRYSYSDETPHLLDANLRAKKALSGVNMALFETLYSYKLID